MSADDARYSKVSRRMWNDEGFRALSPPEVPNAQHLWFRILTGPELSVIPGCFQAWDAGLARALRWPIEGVQRCFQEIVDQEMAKADWEVGFVFVPNAIKHNKPRNQNIIKGWRKTWIDLPECSLKHEAHQSLKLFLESFNRNLARCFANTCRTQEQEQEQDQEQEQEQEGDHATPGRKRDEQVRQARQVFEYWQQIHEHPQALFDRKRQIRIVARLEEGRSVAELCAAIRGAKHDPWLMGKDPKSQKVYDGLETILRDAAKVEDLMKLDARHAQRKAPPEPTTGVRPRVADPDEEILRERKREQNKQMVASASPEELAAGQRTAAAVAKMSRGLLR